MIQAVFATLLLLCSAYYSLFLLRIRRGIGALEKPQPTPDKPFVSVIVAARNEEQHIRACIQSLLKQRYPQDCYEIIIVDDESSDKTAEIVEEMGGNENTIRLLRMHSENTRKSMGKPQCIAAAIRSARGELILQTDADCVVPETWIVTFASYFDENVALVAGPVLEQTNATLFSKIQALEYLGLTSTTAGLVGAGRPIICSGANLAYRKSTFLEVNGFGDDGLSCDDVTLLLRISQRDVGSIRFVADAKALVMTQADHSIAGFWNRRTRWASKRSQYEDPTILPSLVALYLFFLSFFLASIASIFLPSLQFLIILVFIWKALLEYRVLAAGASMLETGIPLPEFVIAEFFHVPYIVFAAAVAQVRSVRWKGRVHNR